MEIDKNSSEHIMERNRAFLRKIGRHCVAVGWEDANAGEINASGGFAFSAFVVSVRDFWFLISAGHIIDDINARLQSGRQFRCAKIIDQWAENRIDANAIPFPDIIDPKSVPQAHIYSESSGIDYAWFFLRDYYRNLLEKNGIVPLNEFAWKNVPGALDAYNVWGLPDDCVFEDRDSNGQYRGLCVRPMLIPYQLESNPPATFQLPCQRLFFWPPKQSDGTVMSVKGLSGGPVFGYQYIGTDIKLWLVGVQSKQAESSGLAIACLGDAFGRAFEMAISAKIAGQDLLPKIV